MCACQGALSLSGAIPESFHDNCPQMKKRLCPYSKKCMHVKKLSYTRSHRVPFDPTFIAAIGFNAFRRTLLDDIHVSTTRSQLDSFTRPIEIMPRRGANQDETGEEPSTNDALTQIMKEIKAMRLKFSARMKALEARPSTAFFDSPQTTTPQATVTQTTPQATQPVLWMFRNIHVPDRK